MDNPFCPKCLDHIEDSIHYFFKCSAYSGFRIDFLSKLHECFESDAVPNENVLLYTIENGIYNIDNNIEKKLMTRCLLQKIFL